MASGIEHPRLPLPVQRLQGSRGRSCRPSCPGQDSARAGMNWVDWAAWTVWADWGIRPLPPCPRTAAPARAGARPQAMPCLPEDCQPFSPCSFQSRSRLPSGSRRRLRTAPACQGKPAALALAHSCAHASSHARARHRLSLCPLKGLRGLSRKGSRILPDPCLP